MFHIEGGKNYLADQGSRFPTGGAGNDKGDGSAGEGDSAKIIGAAGTGKYNLFMASSGATYRCMLSKYCSDICPWS